MLRKEQEVAEECRRVRRCCGQGKKEQDVCRKMKRKQEQHEFSALLYQSSCGHVITMPTSYLAIC